MAHSNSWLPEYRYSFESGDPGTSLVSRQPAEESSYMPTATSTELIDITVPLSTLLELDQEEQRQYVLQQAATAIDVPYPVLQDLSDRYSYVSKRARQSKRTSTAPPVSRPMITDVPSTDLYPGFHYENYEPPTRNSSLMVRRVEDLADAEPCSAFSADSTQEHSLTSQQDFVTALGPPGAMFQNHAPWGASTSTPDSPTPTRYLSQPGRPPNPASFGPSREIQYRTASPTDECNSTVDAYVYLPKQEIT